MTMTSAGSYLKAGFAQGYLVLNVVPTWAHPGPGRVGSNAAEEQGVGLEQAVLDAAVVGRQHQVTIGTLCGLAINAIASGRKKKVVISKPERVIFTSRYPKLKG